MEGRLTDEAGDYIVPNVFSTRDLVSRPDNMDETVPHTLSVRKLRVITVLSCSYDNTCEILLSFFKLVCNIHN